MRILPQAAVRDGAGVILIAADGRRAEPGFAVNVSPARVGGAARTTATRTGTQVRKAGQLWVRGNVPDTIGRLRGRARIIQGAVGIIIRLLLRSVEIDDAVVERAVSRPAA